MTKQWGGQRKGSGRPFRKHLKLSEAGGRDLAELTRQWREARNAPTLQPEDIVEELVRDALQKDGLPS